MIVDGVWSSVGSANFDPRSFRINDEINVAMCDANIAAELRRTFEEDAQYTDEWTIERWKQRDLDHRVTDTLASLVKREL